MISPESPLILISLALVIYMLAFLISRSSKNRPLYLLATGAVLVITAGQFSLALAFGLQILVLLMVCLRDVRSDKKALAPGLPLLAVFISAPVLVIFSYQPFIPLLILLFAVTLFSLSFYLLRRRVTLRYGDNL